VIRAKDICYGVSRQVILWDVSAEFRTGQISAILGPNGAGKSTLLGCLTGAIEPTSGSVEIRGRGLSDYSLTELARMRAVLSQSHAVRFPFTAREIVLMGRNPYASAGDAREDEEIADEALHVMDAWALRDRLVPSLSGGEQQRVHIARVLAQVWARDDAYLLLDEPTSALDLKHQYQTLDLIRGLCDTENLGVVVVMHDLTLARRFADRVYFMKAGSIVQEGVCRDVINPRTIGDIYGIPEEYAALHAGA